MYNIMSSNAHPENRPEQIKESFVWLINKHLQDLVSGKDEEMLEIEDFARLMFIHPTHFSNTIKETTGGSPCDLYQHKIIEVARELLADSSRSIQDIALVLTFEPSHFGKWFKRFAGVTPKVYRKQLAGHPQAVAAKAMLELA